MFYCGKSYFFFLRSMHFFGERKERTRIIPSFFFSGSFKNFFFFLFCESARCQKRREGEVFLEMLLRPSPPPNRRNSCGIFLLPAPSSYHTTTQKKTTNIFTSHTHIEEFFPQKINASYCFNLWQLCSILLRVCVEITQKINGNFPSFLVSPSASPPPATIDPTNKGCNARRKLGSSVGTYTQILHVWHQIVHSVGTY